MIAYLGLGTNLGSRIENIKCSILQLRKIESIKVLRQSAIIATKAWGKEDQPDFLNCVIEIETLLNPKNLLIKCQEIEDIMGRMRNEKWGPRIIDIDILLIDSKIIKEKELIVPHPYLSERLFVLESLNELIPEYIHPELNKKISELYKELL